VQAIDEESWRARRVIGWQIKSAPVYYM